MQMAEIFQDQLRPNITEILEPLNPKTKETVIWPETQASNSILKVILITGPIGTPPLWYIHIHMYYSARKVGAASE